MKSYQQAQKAQTQLQGGHSNQFAKQSYPPGIPQGLSDDLRNDIVRKMDAGEVLKVRKEFKFVPDGERFSIPGIVTLEPETLVRKHEAQDILANTGQIYNHSLGPFVIRVDVISGRETGRVVCVPTDYLTTKALDVLEEL